MFMPACCLTNFPSGAYYDDSRLSTKVCHLVVLSSTSLFKMLLKYRPEDKASKKEGLLNKAQANAAGKKVATAAKKPIVVKYSLKHVSYLIEQVKTTPSSYPSSAEIVPEPLGVVLVISTWNYPILPSDPLPCEEQHESGHKSRVPYIWIIRASGILLLILVIFLLCVSLRASFYCSRDDVKDSNGRSTHKFVILRNASFCCASGRDISPKSGDWKLSNSETSGHQINIPQGIHG